MGTSPERLGRRGVQRTSKSQSSAQLGLITPRLVDRERLKVNFSLLTVC
jgi:hypothetical protein